MTPHYFEDVQVGQRFQTATHTMTRDEVVRFAQEFDPQPMHLTDEGGRASMFGELVASGWHTFTLTMRLVVDAKPLGGTPLVGIRVKEVHIPRPLKPDETFYAVGEVVSVRASHDAAKPFGYVDVKMDTLRDDGALLAQQTWTLAVPKTPA